MQKDLEKLTDITINYRLTEGEKVRQIREILDNNPEFVNMKVGTKYGGTLLHCAAGEGELGIVKLLLEKGASVDDSSGGWTPLHWASTISGRLEIAKELLKKGASANVETSYGRTPLHYAAERKGGVEFAKLLLQNGANPNAEDKDGKTPLDIAREKGNTAIITSLEKAAQPKSDIGKTVTESFQQLSL